MHRTNCSFVLPCCLFAILPIHFQTLLVKIGGQPKITQPRLQTKDIGSKINMPPPLFRTRQCHFKRIPMTVFFQTATISFLETHLTLLRKKIATFQACSAPVDFASTRFASNFICKSIC